MNSVMKRVLVLAILLLSACVPVTPLPPITASLRTEFTLAPGQSATISDTGLTVTLVSVPGDQRCPLNIECAMSGPVSISISVQSDSGTPQEFSFYSFTDNDGSVPDLDFEGMITHVEFEAYVIQIKSVLPFPQNKIGEIKDSQYRISFVIEEK